MKSIYSCLALLFMTSFGVSQTNNNGKLDLITEFTSIETVQFIMPDGIKLATDLYYPIISDSVSADIAFGGSTYTIQLIPKGTQLFVYDSIGDSLNPNKYQLPLVYTRTPYGKNSYDDSGVFEPDEFGVYLNMLGYTYALQDMRGRYDSEGVYMPMYSDGWRKDKYYSTQNPLDVTSAADPRNGNKHEDGKYTLLYIMDSLYRAYDLDNDGIKETNDKAYNGSFVMFGASALGNTQYQAASSLPIDVNKDGLKGLIPIVATNEHFNGVIQHNGVFRQALVQGWMTGQLEDNIDTIPSDTDIHNVLHSVYDYGNIPGDSIISRGVDFATSVKDANGYTGMYPNSLIRKGLNANSAPVNSLGESDSTGTFNRYSNLEVPAYHLTGWWDIFIDGQIETYNHIMANTSSKTRQNQKLVIGPWTHRTIALDTVGDAVYPSSIFDINVANRQELSTSYSDLVDGEVVDWLRYLLNYDDKKLLGEPKVLIPESDVWQPFGTYLVRVPAEDYYITYPDFLNYVGGFSGLDSLPVEVDNMGVKFILPVDVPADSTAQQPGTTPVSDPVSPKVDYSLIPNVRYYVPGPLNDGVPQNANVGNYWAEANEFPLTTKVSDYTMYFHGDGSLDTSAPVLSEPTISYNHDPENPVITVGGGNLVLETPVDKRENAGPINFTNPNYDSLTMTRPDVIQFISAPVVDSLKIVGIPKAKLYASTTPLSGPAGVTSTDFFVRVLDVYPDGRELFVVEGAVNSRARDYAKQLATGIEDVNIPYTNINPNQSYEYDFQLLPIAYTFGHNHKIKVLISSSNWPRYQSNPNVPIEQGDFFRRTPNDGKTYDYNGTTYAARTANQEIFFSPSEPSQITFPMYDGISPVGVEEVEKEGQFSLYPNPTQDEVSISSTRYKNYTVEVYDVTGKLKYTNTINAGLHTFSLAKFSKGVYLVEITTEDGYKESVKVLRD